LRFGVSWLDQAESQQSFASRLAMSTRFLSRAIGSFRVGGGGSGGRARGGPSGLGRGGSSESGRARLDAELALEGCARHEER